MKTYNQKGVINVATLVASIMSLAFVLTLIFALMSFTSGQDYKNNSDKKVDAAVAVAVKDAEAKKDASFAEAEKSPVKTYSGPATFGTVIFDYPKSYSGYVVSSNGGTPLDGSFYPGVVPGSDTTIAYALRMQVIATDYDSLVKQYDTDLKAGKVSVKPFRAAKVPGTLGVRVDGQIDSKKQGSVVLLPLRDKTLKIWTESKEFTADFDKYVLPNLSFVP